MRRRAGMVAAPSRRSSLRLPLAPLAIALAVGAFAGCSGGSADGDAAPDPAEAPESPSDAAPQAPAAEGGRGGRRDFTVGESEPNDDAEHGALQVTFSFEGKPPERFPLGAASSPECKHHAEVDQLSNLVLVQDGKLANVFVTLKSGVDPARVPPVPDAPAELDQRGCMYVPRVVALRVGQTLAVHNSDPTAHNVNLQAKRNKASNRSMGANQKALEFVFDQRELGILAKCDIHPWMGAQIHVEEHPWFGISDSGGDVRIAGIPPGEYTLEARHEVYGTLSGKISVAAGRTARLTASFRAK